MNFSTYSIVILSIAGLAYSGNNFYDSLPGITTDNIKALRQELFVTRKYDKHAIPIPKLDQLRIEVHYSLVNLRDFDVKTQSVVMEGWLWFQWHDDSLKWKPSQWHNITTMRVPSDEIYLPDIMAYNGIDYTTKKMVNTNAILYSKGMVLWVPPITTRAMCEVNIRHWPFDEHICYLKFGSWTHDGNIMDVKHLGTANKSVLSDFWKNSEFDVQFLNVTNKITFYDCCAEPYPSVVFYFKLQHQPTLYHYIISVPALVAIISSLITFWFPIRSKIRFLLNGLSLLTLTLLLLFVGKELGFGGLAVPIAVRILSLTTLLVGFLQIWFTIGYNISQLSCQIPMWTMKLTKPLLKQYTNSDQDSVTLTQIDATPETVKKSGQPTAEDLTNILDKIVFVGFSLALIINTFV